MVERLINLNCRNDFSIISNFFLFFRRSSPWMVHGEEAVTSRLIVLSLLDCFSGFGWKLHASIDISQEHGGRDSDSWFLRRETQ